MPREKETVLEAVDDDNERSIVDQASQALGGLGGTAKKKGRKTVEKAPAKGKRLKERVAETGEVEEFFELDREDDGVEDDTGFTGAFS